MIHYLFFKLFKKRVLRYTFEDKTFIDAPKSPCDVDNTVGKNVCMLPSDFIFYLQILSKVLLLMQSIQVSITFHKPLYTYF